MLAKNFKVLEGYIRAFDGYRKPKINFEEMYKLFPTMTFEALEGFGSYKGFNEAFGYKRFPMRVTDADGKECYLTYKEYTDNHDGQCFAKFETMNQLDLFAKTFGFFYSEENIAYIYSF